jgi:hypothetical protein
MDKGVYEWGVKCNLVSGSWLCLGIIAEYIDIAKYDDQYFSASCVASDNTVYNMDVVKGKVNIQSGDIVRF